jgi:hypothetical protein
MPPSNMPCSQPPAPCSAAAASASEMVDAAVEMLVEIGEALKGDKAG